MASERLNAAIAEMAKQDITFANCDSTWQKRVMTAVLAAADTRPAPAATDTGLVTVAWFQPSQRCCDNGWMEAMAWQEGEFSAPVVLRSQAEELLAAKDKTIALAETTMIEMHQDPNKLEADNAAQAARIKDLEEYAREATKVITGLTGGGSENFGKQIGDVFTADLPYCLERIRERYVSKVELKRVEAKLAAAGKVAEEVLSLIAGDASIPDRIRDKASAVLGGKPS